MQFLSVGQRAEGFIAIGQEATGIIAIGQIATGVFALGQMARGVIAVGQLAIGLVAVGMLALGPVYCVAMIGAGARGKGGVLPIVPMPTRKAVLPGLATLAEITSRGATGWLPITVVDRGGTLSVMHQGSVLDATIGTSIAEGARTAATRGITVLGLFGPSGGKPELRRLMRMEDDPFATGPARIVVWMVQLVALAIACAVLWEFVFVDVGDFALAALRFIVTGT